VGINTHCCCEKYEETSIEFHGARLIRLETIEPEIAFVVAIEFHSKILLKHLAYAKLASFLFTEKEFQDLAKQTEGKRLRKHLWDSEESERLLFCSISPLQRWILFFNLKGKNSRACVWVEGKNCRLEYNSSWHLSFINRLFTFDLMEKAYFHGRIREIRHFQPELEKYFGTQTNDPCLRSRALLPRSLVNRLLQAASDASAVAYSQTTDPEDWDEAQ